MHALSRRYVFRSLVDNVHGQSSGILFPGRFFVCECVSHGHCVRGRRGVLLRVSCWSVLVPRHVDVPDVRFCIELAGLLPIVCSGQRRFLIRRKTDLLVRGRCAAELSAEELSVCGAF